MYDFKRTRIPSLLGRVLWKDQLGYSHFRMKFKLSISPLTSFPFPPSTYIIPGKKVDLFSFYFWENSASRILQFCYFTCRHAWDSNTLLVNVLSCYYEMSPWPGSFLVLFSGTSVAITLSCLLLARHTFFHPDGFKLSAYNWVLLFQPVGLLCG